jgi:hypothetical protein
MPTMRKYILLVIAICFTSACDVTPVKGVPSAESKPFQRFLPLPDGVPVYGVPRPFLALDTVTGRLCQTVDSLGPQPSQAVLSAPTCQSLYANDPY